MQDLNAIPNLADMPPLLTWQDARSVEASNCERGQIRPPARRGGSKSGAELLQAVRTATDDEANAMIELMEGASAHLEWRSHETEVLDACFARLVMALETVATEMTQEAGHV